MSGMAKIRNWRARHPAWCARCPPERRTRRTARPGGKTIRPGIRACGASLRKSAEPAPPESGTRKKRVEHSTRFRPLKRAKRQKKRLGKKFEKGVVNPFSFKITPRRARRTGPQALFVGSLAQKRSFCAKLKRVECSARFFRACQEKRFLTRSQKEASGVLSCGAASESSVSEEDAVSSSGRPAVFITNFTLARTPSALPV